MRMKSRQWRPRNYSWQVLAIALALSVRIYAQGPVPPIESGYGAEGPFSVAVETFRSPLWLTRDVTVFLPEGATMPVPTIFFSHGFMGTDPDFYISLLHHIASRGYAVVFSPYPASGDEHDDRYAK